MARFRIFDSDSMHELRDAMRQLAQSDEDEDRKLQLIEDRVKLLEEDKDRREKRRAFMLERIIPLAFTAILVWVALANAHVLPI